VVAIALQIGADVLGEAAARRRDGGLLPNRELSLVQVLDRKWMLFGDARFPVPVRREFFVRICHVEFSR
jgi:hypothetical protein